MTTQEWIGLALLFLAIIGVCVSRAYLYGFDRGIQKGLEIGKGKWDDHTGR